jgi:hypothetical protein
VMNIATAGCSTSQTYFSFECGFPAPVPVTIPSNGVITANTPTLLSQAEFYIPLNYHSPYVDSWNVAVQQALPMQFNATLSYVANHGTRLGVGQNINLANALNEGSAGYPLDIAFGKTVSVTEDFLGFSTNYQSLQAELNRRFSGDLGVTTSFTWGKALDYQTGGDDDGGLLFWLDQRHSYGIADFNHKFNFEESITWVLPFGPHQRWLNSGAVASVLGGWQLSGVLSLYSGLPMNIEASGNSINTSGEQQMTNLTGSYSTPKGIGAGHNWFNPAAFSQPTGCTGTVGTACPLAYGTSIGNVGRNAYQAPGYIQNDASLFKDFQLHENWTFDFRCDAFQLTNSPQFTSPATSITSGTFGQVTGTVGSGTATGINSIGGGRSLQLSGTVRF